MDTKKNPLNTLLRFAIILFTTIVFFGIAASPVEASNLVELRTSRLCIEYGETLRMRITTLLSVPATVTVQQHKLVDGRWTTVVSKIKPFVMTTDTEVFKLKLPRGRYRFRMIIMSPDGVRYSPKVEFAVVSRKVVALTFDDGPWTTYTTDILAQLKKRDVRATFFMCGYTLKARPVTGKKVVRLQHEIGNHSYRHPVLSRMSSARIGRELGNTQRLIKRTLGVTPKWVRPPYGATSSRVRSVAKKYGLKHILWTVDTSDWRLRSSSAIASRALRSARRDSVILMHDGGGNRRTTVNALPKIINTLKSRGYDFVTLSELSELKRNR